MYRIIFLLAGLYNLFFAIWLSISPISLFGLINISIPFSESYVIPLALGIVMFVPIYFYAVFYPDKSWNGIAFCLLAKIGTLLIAGLLIALADWPMAILKMVFFNDIVWWIPFFLFLAKKISIRNT